MEMPPEPIIKRQRSKRPRIKTEIVDTLFPENRIILTQEQIQFYRRVGQFAFAIDRQSHEDVLQDAKKTGQEVRVEAILGVAEDILKVYVPRPPENPNWLVGGRPQLGETQYDFKHKGIRADCEAFWFVDGVNRNASGYIINEVTRPELWRAYHTAIRLAEAGCPPKAYIVGEPTRFFREENWISLFYDGLAKKAITLYVVPFGEINKYNKGAYIQYVNALSGRILEHSQNARQAYERRGKIFNRRCTLGLLIDREAEHPAQADPKYWPVLSEMCSLIADGTLPKLSNIVLWLHEHGISRSTSWVRKLLRDQPGVLDGIYRAYCYHSEPIECEDRSGLLRDPSVTENGNRRYITTISDGKTFPVYFPEGTAPIPPPLLAAARNAILNRRGKPQKDTSRLAPRRSLGLIPQRKLRCATCGSGVGEYNPPPDSNRVGWKLYCGIVDRLVQSGDGKVKAMTLEEARAHPAAQHPKYLGAQVSEPLWELLVQELTAQAPVPIEEKPDAARERRAWQQRKAEAEEQRRTITTNFLLLKDPSADVIRIVEQKQKELEAIIADCERHAQLAAAEILETAYRAETFTYYRETMARYLAGEYGKVSLDDKREIVEAMVEEVVVNLETGQFWARIKTPQPVLRSSYARANNNTSPRALAHIVLVGQARARWPHTADKKPLYVTDDIQRLSPSHRYPVIAG